MERTRPTSFAIDSKTRTILKDEANKRGLTRSGLLRALVHALRNGRVIL